MIDTDMAPDDVTAIASLLRDPVVEVLAITVSGTGEAHCSGGMFVARSVVTMLLDHPLPVACGQEIPMGDAEPFPAGWRAGADSGNGLTLTFPEFEPDRRSAEQVLVDLAANEASAGRKLTILTLGTLTNLASALELDPDLPEKVIVVSMLGAVDVPGNVNPEIIGSADPTAEWNAHADPTAVRIVLEAGFDLTLVPLDATNDVPLTPELYLELEADHAAGPADLVFELWARNSYMRDGSFFLWDPLAAAAVRNPGLLTTRPATLTVIEGAGLDGGRLLEDPAGSPVIIATSADRPAFEAFLLSLLRVGGPRGSAFQSVATVAVTAGDAACEARLDPPAPPPGTLRVEARNATAADQTVVVFELGQMTWPEVESFAADPAPLDPSGTPPPVVEVAWIPIGPGDDAAAYGEAPAGLLGVACIAGTDEAPIITLAGPFPIGP